MKESNRISLMIQFVYELLQFVIFSAYELLYDQDFPNKAQFL